MSAFVPVPGQSFSSEQDWVNRAQRVLTDHPEYNNTQHPKKTGWQGHHFTALCFDQAGNRMQNGGDFKRATAKETYPVWWVWPDQIVGLLSAKLAGSAPTTGQHHGAQAVLRELVPAVHAYLMAGDAMAQAGKRRAWEPVLKRADLILNSPAPPDLLGALSALADAVDPLVATPPIVGPITQRVRDTLKEARVAIAKSAGERS